MTEIGTEKDSERETDGIGTGMRQGQWGMGRNGDGGRGRDRDGGTDSHRDMKVDRDRRGTGKGTGTSGDRPQTVGPNHDKMLIANTRLFGF